MINTIRDSSSFYTGQRPSQKKSFKAKIANDFEWARNCIDYYGSQNSNGGTDSRDKIKKRYDWFNGNFDINDFQKTVNPLNSPKHNYKQWGADIRSFNIMRPIIDRLSSEYRKRPFGYTVETNNPDSVTANEQMMMQQIQQVVRQDFINTVNELMGTDEASGSPTQETPQIEDVRKNFANLRDQRAITGSNALELILADTLAKETWNEAMRDWLIAGDVVTRKQVDDKSIKYRRFKSGDCGWDETATYIEDGEYAWSLESRPLSWIVDQFYDELTDDVIKDLESGTEYGYNVHNPVNNNGGHISVLHVNWKSFEKIGILTYVDEMSGQVLQMEVPEEYKAGPDEEIEWFWIPQVWEGYRLDGKHYIQVRPVPFQRTKMDDLGYSKLMYNGRVYSEDYHNRVSVASICVPYQIEYLITMRQIELTMAKNKSKVLILDKNVIPNKDGWDEEKFMYYGQALGYLFVNRNQIGVDKSFNQYSVLNMSTVDETLNLIQIAEWIDAQLKEQFGITPAREGQHAPKSGTGQMEQELFQSAVVSEEIYARFDDFIQRELQGLLDISKYAWRDGKRAKYVGSDLRHIMLDLDPANHISSEYGVFVSTDPRSLDTLKRMQQAVHAFAQNGASPVTILEVLDSQTPAKLKESLIEMEAKTQQQQQQQQEAEQQSIQLQAQTQQQQMQQQHVFDLDTLNVEYDRKEQLAAVEAGYQAALTPETPEQIDNSGADRELKSRELASKESIERDKLTLAAKMKAADLADNQSERASKAAIETMKAKTALKNKVVGEK